MKSKLASKFLLICFLRTIPCIIGGLNLGYNNNSSKINHFMRKQILSIKPTMVYLGVSLTFLIKSVNYQKNNLTLLNKFHTNINIIHPHNVKYFEK